MNNILGEVWRHSFPKGLRYCKQCLILHSSLTTLTKRYKHKKYIPRAEVEDMLATFVPMPGAPVTQLPVVRHMLMIRLINAIRVALLHKPSWLFTRSVQAEYEKVQEWMSKDLKNVANKRLDKFVDREKFTKEVLGSFHVASMYHRGFRFGICVVFVLLCVVVAELCYAELLLCYLRYWRWMSDQELLEYFREVTERHTVHEVPPGYAKKVPPPCALMPVEGSSTPSQYVVNVCEFVSPDERHRVVFIPCPQVGTKTFYEEVGKVLRKGDVLLLEGVPMEHINRVTAALLLPMKQPTFGAFGLHHRFYDVLHGSKDEPPKLFPGGAPHSLLMTISQSVVPMAIRYVIWPTLVSGTKAEARVAWGRLRELLMEDDLANKHPSTSLEEEEKHLTICVPWSVSQVVNLEASLLKLGYTLLRTYPIPWLNEDYMGDHVLGKA